MSSITFSPHGIQRCPPYSHPQRSRGNWDNARNARNASGTKKMTWRGGQLGSISKCYLANISHFCLTEGRKCRSAILKSHIRTPTSSLQASGVFSLMPDKMFYRRQVEPLDCAKLCFCYQHQFRRCGTDIGPLWVIIWGKLKLSG